MRIIQLSPRIPYPLVDGGSISIYNLTHQLKRLGAEIYFVAFYREDGDLNGIKQLCKDVLILNKPEINLQKILGNFLSEVPLNIAKYHSHSALSQILEFATGNQVELIHVDHLHMAYYGLALKKVLGIPAVLREHNVEMRITERMRKSSPNLFYRFVAAAQEVKFRMYEPKVCEEFDVCLMITDEDRKFIKQLNPRINAITIPAGVEVRPLLTTSGKDDTILYLGSLDWLPNIYGLQWFIRKVMPLVILERPGAKLHIYGKNPIKLARSLHDGVRVFVHGYVPDVEEAFNNGNVVIVPLHVGSGLRLKILQAMSFGKVVVSTSVGSEGIKAHNGREIFIADTPERFASIVSNVLRDEQLRVKVGAAAAEFVRREHSWEAIGNKLWSEYSLLLKKAH